MSKEKTKSIKDKVETIKVELGKPETMSDIFNLNKKTFIKDESEEKGGLALWGKPNKKK